MASEKYLYPTPEQSWESLKEWMSEIRKHPNEIKCPWDEEELKLWIMNLWFTCWGDVLSYIQRRNLKDKLFAWGIGKYWCEKGNCTLAERQSKA